ncbi:ABC transporter permease [Brevibacterium linens]|uniref:Iron complex transport system permease protein n=2 Tax=Brevibacterium linens TaxID=1703 RepID=A0A2H1JJX8_BRELN|nr:iron chelate uptake ABC transporter family permease subunit [Brevibacterium linens]AZT99583.1 iron ABC transporter permease [Brevibacterium linens]KAB1948673.1 iron chelate uptake ABC transporter family permease subunit [Brevibacterium linens ATCC 9172]SMX83193.1 iron complex transport system permease protein [Brevibacterium linens ATCC 9172]SMX87826.1 iron complex transport system permease protein [Brevibacterium linens]
MTLAEAARRRNEARRNRTAESPQGTADPSPDGTAVLSPSGTAASPPRGAASANTPLFGWPLVLGILGVAILLAISLLTGVYDVFGGDGGAEMFQITRIPRTIALVLAGAAMAMCGLVMQLLTQNRFVEPTTTGTTEWAGLGLMLTVIIYPDASIVARMVGAIIAAFIGTLVFFVFLRRVSLKSSLIVPIVGIMLGAVVGAVSTFIAVQTDMLQSLGIWFAGSFTSILRGQYETLWIVAAVVVAIFVLADRFTVAGLGKEIATNVGLNYNQILLLGTVFVAIATGVVTVVVGNLPFLGLIVPNIVSLIRGDDLRSNLPWVCLLGIAIVTICDLIGRIIVMPFEVPVSLILGVVGAAVFVALLLRQRKVG